MKKRKKVLLIIPFINQFIQKDIDFLESEFSLTISNQNWKIKPLVPFFLIFQLLQMIFIVPGTDKIVIQFGGFWSLIPCVVGRLFKKPIAIILHGTDCASIPSLNYGSLRKKLLKKALFLFILGTLFLTIWPADILHFYGIYLTIIALSLKLKDKQIL